MSNPVNPPVNGARVFVGLSGGVDSAVTAARLQEAGALVTGVFIKGWYPPGMPCTWADDRRDAMRVAARLGIPFNTLEAGAEYKHGVIDYLLAEYKAGRTPNPDIMCNREVKFGAFYQFARTHGADWIATGHYAQAVVSADDTHQQLMRGIDPTKDQSYFLWAIAQEALNHTLFPLGSLHKDETRKLATKYNLPVARKKDSQGICFLGSLSVEDFLRAEFSPKPGTAVIKDGTQVGIHSGAILHTLGSRVALQDAESGPWYVLAKDMETNTLTVGHTLHIPKTDTVREISLTHCNWFYEADSDAPIEAQYRYHGPRIRGTLSRDHTAFIPHQPLDEPLAAGQSLVLYVGDRCMGGGIIA